jgi:hypothetical protein
MTPKQHADGSRVTTANDSIQAVQENREELKDLAESDLPVAWIARTLLDAEAVTQDR